MWFRRADAWTTWCREGRTCWVGHRGASVSRPLCSFHLALDSCSSGKPLDITSTFLRLPWEEARQDEGFLPINPLGQGEGGVRQAKEGAQPGHVLHRSKLGCRVHGHSGRSSRGLLVLKTEQLPVPKWWTPGTAKSARASTVGMSAVLRGGGQWSPDCYEP